MLAPRRASTPPGRYGKQPAVRIFRKEPELSRVPTRLHIGCGEETIPGWINIDSRPLPGVDRLLDVRRGLPFERVAAIYAEHFLEHLALEDGLAFLRECRRALAPSGILRLSTPNLDWVYATHYKEERWNADLDAVTDCLQINRAFHGWGHRFLFNRPMLEAAFRAAGFASIRFHAYGQSEIPELRGLERHQTWQDTPELPHVIIGEASGHAPGQPIPEKLLREYREAIEIK